MTFKKILFPALAAGMLITASGSTFAADAAGEIKYRKAVMKSIGGHMGAIVGILKGETDNRDNLTMHTEGMAALSRITGTLFADKTGPMDGETTATPAIWEKPEEFKKALVMFQDAAKKMQEAGASGDMAMVGDALGGLGKSCKNCHDNFREKK